MADFYMLQGDYKRAGALHKTLTSKDQPLIARVVGYVNEYELHLYLGKYSEASQAIDKAIELASEEGDKAAAAGRLWKALLMVGLDDMDNSWRETGKTIPFHSNISRRSTSYWPHFFYLSIVNDNFESHRTTLSNIRIGWLRPWVLAINSGLNGDCTTAEVHADTVFQASPADAKVVLLYHLSECYLENEQLDKAEKSLHRLLQTYSWNSLRAFLYPKSLYVLGQVYEKKGDIAQAIQMYEKFLDLWKEADPDLPELADAKSRLADLKAGRFK